MITLQNFILPDSAICTEYPLYVRLSEETGVSQSEGRVWIGQGAQISFNTYFNALNLLKWADACTLDGLFAEIRGKGRVELRVVHALFGRSWQIMYNEILTLEPDTPVLIDLKEALDLEMQGMLFVEMRSLDESGAEFLSGRFATGSLPATLPRLAVSITTFKREVQVRETVARLEQFLASFEHADQIHVQVVDNGQSAEIENSDKVTAYLNPNYGGAGGFARGLMEAEKAGFSHCLFMDDDASFHMENIARTYLFLALAKDPKTAVAGAMINNTHKWAIWENGAWFDGSCHPLYCGLDLRDFGQILKMENESGRRQRATLYGGWWFFAFAINEVERRPFPFFVRGDDISFSLMNNFRITTLNGVVSFQDDFSEKESPQTLYLDLRNHIIHHLVSDKIARTPMGTALVPIRFVMRSLVRFHYESAAAQLMAWRDVMRGPDFFDENIDMATRRGDIKEMMKTEVWQPADPADLSEKKRLTKLPRKLRHLIGYGSLNGHLLPFSSFTWDKIKLDMPERGIVYPAFGATKITYLNATGDKAYTVTQDKKRFFSLCWEMFQTTRAFLRDFDKTKAAYREGYTKLTAPEFWQKKLS